jgi:hypothetical protein
MIFDHNRSLAEIANGKFHRLTPIFSPEAQEGASKCDQVGECHHRIRFLLGKKKKIGENP